MFSSCILAYGSRIHELFSVKNKRTSFFLNAVTNRQIKKIVSCTSVYSLVLLWYYCTTTTTTFPVSLWEDLAILGIWRQLYWDTVDLDHNSNEWLSWKL